MHARHLAREKALQFLYQCDAGGDGAPEARAAFFADARLDPDAQAFAEALVAGTLAQRDALDALLGARAANWAISRMGVVDRNILRLAAYELLHHLETPPRVALNEAIELAKRFGNERSGAFVNGVLDALMPQAEAARRVAPAPPGS